MQIMVTSTGLCLAASRFGLAPSVKKVAAPSLKLSDRAMDLVTNDPAGFTAADTLAMGAAGEPLDLHYIQLALKLT